MSRDLHFSLDNLPERYRAQVARQLVGGQGRQIVRPNPTEASKGRICASGEKRKAKGRSPIRMKRNRDGMSAAEVQFGRDVLLGEGKYEAVTLHLPGDVNYTPDFLLEKGGEIFLFEVKGSYHLPTHGRSVMAFKVACECFPMFTFVFAEQCAGGQKWRIGKYRKGLEIGSAEGTAAELHNM